MSGRSAARPASALAWPPPPPDAIPATVEPRRPPLGRPFWLLWAASIVSGIGDGLVFIGYSLLAERLTDNALLIAGVVVADRVPAFLFGLHAGALVDRHDRRRLLQGVELFRMLVLGVFAMLVLAGHAGLPLLYAAIFLASTAQTAFTPAVHAVVPSLVPSDELARSNGLLYAAETSTTQMIGPALGGIVFAAAVAAPFVVNSVSFALSAILLTIGLPLTRRVTLPPRTSSISADVRSGLRYFRRHPVLRTLAAVIATLAFFQSMVFAPLVLFALRTLGLSGAAFGVMFGVAAIGDVVGGLLAGRVDERFGPARILRSAGIAAALAYLTLSLAPNAVVAALALFVEAMAVAFGNVSSLALRQRIIPNEMLGRVSNIFRFAIFAALPLGALAGGAIGNQWGFRAPFVVAALGQAIVILALGPRLHRVIGANATAPS